MSDITSTRRGQINSVELVNQIQTISADVPLSCMVGYSTVIRTLTGGSGTFLMRFDRYENVQSDVEKAILDKCLGRV